MKYRMPQAQDFLARAEMPPKIGVGEASCVCKRNHQRDQRRRIAKQRYLARHRAGRIRAWVWVVGSHCGNRYCAILYGNTGAGVAPRIGTPAIPAARESRRAYRVESPSL